MLLPEVFTNKLKGLPGYDHEAFVAAHEAGQLITSVRLNPRKLTVPVFETETTKVPWAEHGYYLAHRPSFTFDPLFHAGTYYVQEASSMLLELAMRQFGNLNEPQKVLDLCAAPGGKSTHLQSLISPSGMLVSNEVIRNRASILRDNIIKWGGGNVVVTNNDPADLGKLADYFDTIVIDAPCSGSGLFRRDPQALDEWSEDAVQFCSQRQRRIIADILPALKENGLLVYSTCSYSEEEDEKVLEWLQQTYKLEPLRLAIDDSWNITEVNVEGAYGYRCWPHLVKGEGFFLSAFKKKQEGTGFVGKGRAVAARLDKKENAIVSKWMHTEEKTLVKKGNTVFAWPVAHEADFDYLLSKMHVLYAGVRAGEMMRDKLVPDHALALSGWVHEDIPKTELSLEAAIQYLQRKDFSWPNDNKGWQLASYKGFPIGWANVLVNRFNNYYPKELRILKEK